MSQNVPTRTAIFILYISLVLFGCVEADVYYGQEIKPDCGRLIQHTCDVRSISCQRDLFEIAICAREDEIGILPDVLSIDRDELRRILSDPVDSGEEESAREKAWTKAHQLLGLLPEEESFGNAMSDDLLEEVVGFYSAEAQILVLIDYGEPMNSDRMNETLIHEFVHALQDQTVGLDAFAEEMQETTDGAVARKALIEGEAVHFTVIAVTLMFDKDPRAFDWDGYYGGNFDSMLEGIDDAEVPFVTALTSFPYLAGAPYVTDAYLLSGEPRTEALFEDPITTTVEWMLGYSDTSFELGSLSCALPQAPEDTEQLDRDRFGAVGVVALLVENGMTGSNAWDFAKRWRWDEIAVYGSEQASDASTFVAYRTVWASEDDASEFATVLNDAGFVTSNRSVALDEQEVLIVASDNPDDLLAWTETFECVAPQEARDDQQPDAMRKKILPIHPIRFPKL